MGQHTLLGVSVPEKNSGVRMEGTIRSQDSRVRGAWRKGDLVRFFWL